MDSFGLDTFASRAIYKDFIAGKIINAYDYIDGELQPSPKFRNLVDNLDKYRELYSLLGFEIQTVNNDAFYVKRADRSEDFNEVAANIQVLLTVIGRGLCGQGTNPSILFDPNGGASGREINTIGVMEQESRITKACGLHLPLTRSVNGILLERGIVHRTRQDRYILSSAGQYLFKELFGPSDLNSVNE